MTFLIDCKSSERAAHQHPSVSAGQRKFFLTVPFLSFVFVDMKRTRAPCRKGNLFGDKKGPSQSIRFLCRLFKWGHFPENCTKMCNEHSLSKSFMTRIIYDNAGMMIEEIFKGWTFVERIPVRLNSQIVQKWEQILFLFPFFFFIFTFKSCARLKEKKHIFCLKKCRGHLNHSPTIPEWLSSSRLDKQTHRICPKWENQSVWWNDRNFVNGRS